MILVREQDEQLIAADLQERALVAMDLVDEPGKNAIDKVVQLTALHLFGHARVARQIAEQDRDVNVLGLKVGTYRIGVDFLGDRGRRKLVHIVPIAAQSGAPDRQSHFRRQQAEPLQLLPVECAGYPGVLEIDHPQHLALMANGAAQHGFGAAGCDIAALGKAGDRSRLRRA